MRLKFPRRNPAQGEQGQATIEFALTILLVLAFVLLYVQASMVFAWANYIQYATFMSARAYLSAGHDQEDQARRARDVMVVTVKRGIGQPNLDRIPFLAEGEGGGEPRGVMIDAPAEFEAQTRDLSWLEGVRYRFKSRVFLVPLSGPSTAPVNTVTLVSESWLGREPSYQDCLGYMGEGWIIDNGC